MGMNRPVILDNVDMLGAGIGRIQTLIESTHLLTPDNVVIPIRDLPAASVERSNQPPLPIGRRNGQDLWALRRSGHPSPSALRPAKKAHFIQEHQDTSVGLTGYRSQTRQQIGHFVLISRVRAKLSRPRPAP